MLGKHSIRYLDLTFPTPEQNLAADEALLDACDSGAGPELLRCWEARSYFVVLGYANRVDAAVHRLACQASQVPILRRCSGGGAVLQGPGCLNYSLILRLEESGPLRSVPETNRWIMEGHCKALRPLLGHSASVQGTTDLALADLKFSGNAQRRKRRALLFHGTFLLSLDLVCLEAWLAQPRQQPAYRAQRSHREFLTNLSLAPALLKETLREHWHAQEPCREIPNKAIERLVRERYGRAEWNYRF